MRSATALSRGASAKVRPAITATGVSAPAGSLDRWFEARNGASASLVEVAVFGDSTMYGQTDTGPYYSPVQRIRERYIAAGYTDGGHGNLNGAGDVTSTGESIASTGFIVGGTGVLPGESVASDVVDDSETFTRVGRYLTLWYSRLNTAGRFSYQIDGGAEVTVDPPYTAPGGVVTFSHMPVIDMGSDGTHTITVRNKGGRLVTAPSYTGGTGYSGSGAGGTITPGTYDYACAFVTPDGKIGPLGPTRTAPITTGQTFTFNMLPQTENGGPTTNLYRRASGVGNFKLIGSGATSSGSPYQINDTGATAPGIDYALGAAPVLNTGLRWVCVATIVTKATGLVLHNFAARGSSSGMAAGDDLLGLTLGLDTESRAAAVTRAIDTTSGARRPVLAILTHGINDQQASATDNSATYGANTVKAIRAARRAGADVLVTLPCWESANQQQNASLYRAAGKAAAEGEGAAWIDLGIGGALPGVTPGGTNPHLSVGQYQAQGDFIWNQLLGL